jgi:hypothetical protein
METITNFASQGNAHWIVYDTLGKDGRTTYTAALMLGDDGVPTTHDTYPNLTQALRRAGITQPVEGVTRYLDGQPM